MKARMFVAAALALALAVPAAAAGGDVSGKFSAIAETRENEEGKTEAMGSLYCLLNARRISDVPGLNFNLYGRAATENDEGVGDGNRLYYAYLEKAGIGGAMNVRLGRQFSANAAGLSTIDGVDVKVKGKSPLYIRTFFGGTVDLDDSAGGGDLALGLEAGVSFSAFDAAVSYYEESGGGDELKKLYGFEIYADLAGALELAGDARYDYFRDQLSHVYAEAAFHGVPSFGARLHYLYDVPVFDATSIYSVFAVDLYEEAGAEVTYDFACGVRALARVTHEFNESFADANVYEAGFLKTDGDWTGYFLFTLRDTEEGQEMRGVKALVSYEANRSFMPGAGVHYDVLERRLGDDDMTTSQRWWVFTRSELTEAFALEARVEAGKSDLTGSFNQASLKAEYRF